MPELDKQNIRSCIAVILGLAEELKRGGYPVSDSDALRLAGFAWMATELERLRETIEDEAAMVRVQGALRG